MLKLVVSAAVEEWSSDKNCSLVAASHLVQSKSHVLVSQLTILTKVSFFFPFLNFNFIFRRAPALPLLPTPDDRPRRVLQSSDLLRIVLACFSTWVRWERNSPNLLSPTAFDNCERLSSFPSASCLHMRTRIVSSCSSESESSPSFGVGVLSSFCSDFSNTEASPSHRRASSRELVCLNDVDCSKWGEKH